MNGTNEVKHDTLVSPRDVCTELGISTTTRWRYDKQGILPPVIRIGNRVGYSRKRFDKWKRDRGFIIEEAV